MKKNRFLFLKRLFEETNGNRRVMVNMWRLGEELNFSKEATDIIVDYLSGENLLDAVALGGSISISHWGIKEIEEALENPTKPTTHFLPINIINVGNMSNSTINQSSFNQTSILDESKIRELNSILDMLSLNLKNFELSEAIINEINAEISTLHSQIKSPKPKNVIITECLKTIRSLIEGVASNAVAPFIINGINSLLN